jgi:hypothetical protein
LNAADPQLESARLQPLSLPLDPSRNTGYKLCSSTCELYRCVEGAYERRVKHLLSVSQTCLIFALSLAKGVLMSFLGGACTS